MPFRLLPAPVRRPRMLRLARLVRARIRHRLHLMLFVPAVRAGTWMYFAAAGLVGFGTLEAMLGVFVLAPEVFPIALAGLALYAVVRDRVRRGIRLVRLGLLRVRESRRRQLRRNQARRAMRAP